MSYNDLRGPISIDSPKSFGPSKVIEQPDAYAIAKIPVDPDFTDFDRSMSGRSAWHSLNTWIGLRFELHEFCKRQ